MTDSYSKIIEAASQLMSKNGYHATSLQMIADKVGISKSTIFHHFRNKEAILLSMFKAVIPPAIIVLSELVDNKDLSGHEKLKRFLTFHMNLIATKGNILNIYLSESKHLAARNKKKYMEIGREYTKLIKHIVAQVQQENPNKLRGLNTAIVTNSILGMCNWSVEWYNKKGKLTIDEIAGQMYRIVYN